jgi:predicted O-methyltransferase YrrM
MIKRPLKRLAKKALINVYKSTHGDAGAAAAPTYDIPETLGQLQTKWAGALRDIYATPIARPASLSPAQGGLLRSLLINIRPATVVELGCFVGVSTIWIASALEENGEGIVHSIDLFDPVVPNPPFSTTYLEDPYEAALKNIETAGLSHRVELHKSASADMAGVIPRLLTGPIDFLLIDADHEIKGCVEDFELYHPLVADGGYIMLHDINPDKCGWDGPRFVIDNHIKNSADFELIELPTSPHNHGIALIRKPAPRAGRLDTGPINKVEPPSAFRGLNRAWGFVRNILNV